MSAKARWSAVAEYRSKEGIIDVQHDVEELYELHDLIERGPDWDTLLKVTITLNRVNHPELTVEEAAEL